MKRHTALLCATLPWLVAEGARAQAPAEPAVEARTAPPTTDLSGAVKDAITGTATQVVEGVAGGGGSAPPAAPAALPRGNDPASVEQRLTILRKKVLRDEDFVENDETNRDPFRSYLRLFIEKAPQRVRTMPAIFEKFALEELTLIAIISGDANPRAMFRDPGGLGQVIKKGDYVSKSGARVTKILSDRVILELTEVTATGEPRASEKAVLVNPEAAQK